MTTAIEAAIDVGGNVYLPAGTYLTSSIITKAYTNCKVYGEPGATTIAGSFGYKMFEILSSNDVIFEDLIFNNTYVNASAGGSVNKGIITSNIELGARVLSNITFNRCEFTAPNSGDMAIMILATTDSSFGGTCDNLKITNCFFHDIGGIAITLMNREVASDKYEVFKNVTVDNNLVRNIGTIATWGFFISFDGYGSKFTCNNNRLEDCKVTGIENTRWINGDVSGNRFSGFASETWAPITFSHPDNRISGMNITNNLCEGSANSKVLFFKVDDSYFAGNSWSSTGTYPVQYDDSNNNIIIGDKYVSDSSYACLLVTTTDTFVDGNVTVGTDRITMTSHTFGNRMDVQLTTTGTLPAGLALATTYYTKKIDANTIELYSDLALTSIVDITAAASGGTHTIEAPCQNNLFSGCTFDASGGTNATAVAFQHARTTGNKVIDSVLKKDGGGSAKIVANLLSASDNIITNSHNTEAVITTNVITEDETGKTFFLDLVGGFTSTLPAPYPGLRYTFIVKTAPTTEYIVTTNGGDNIFYGTLLDIVGEQVAITAQDTINFVASTSLIGDSLEVESDGTNWYVSAKSLVDGGITVTVT